MDVAGQPGRAPSMTPSPGSPDSTTSGTSARTAPIRSSRSADSRAASGVRMPTACSSAVANPTSPATLSVPDLIPRSCPPPWPIGTTAVSRRTSSAPTPTGPPILWAETESASVPLAGEVHRQDAGGLDRIGVEGDAVPVGDRRKVGYRIHGADLVVGPHHRDHRDGGRDRRRWPQPAHRDGYGRTGPPPTNSTTAPSVRSSASAHSSTAWCSTGESGCAGGRVGGMPGAVDPGDGDVVGLGPSRRDHDLRGMRPECRRNRLPGLLHETPGSAARAVQRGGVADHSAWRRQRRRPPPAGPGWWRRDRGRSSCSRVGPGVDDIRRASRGRGPGGYRRSAPGLGPGPRFPSATPWPNWGATSTSRRPRSRRPQGQDRLRQRGHASGSDFSGHDHVCPTADAGSVRPPT